MISTIVHGIFVIFRSTRISVARRINKRKRGAQQISNAILVSKSTMCGKKQRMCVCTYLWVHRGQRRCTWIGFKKPITFRTQYGLIHNKNTLALLWLPMMRPTESIEMRWSCRLPLCLCINPCGIVREESKREQETDKKENGNRRLDIRCYWRTDQDDVCQRHSLSCPHSFAYPNVHIRL